MSLVTTVPSMSRKASGSGNPECRGAGRPAGRGTAAPTVQSTGTVVAHLLPGAATAGPHPHPIPSHPVDRPPATAVADL